MQKGVTNGETADRKALIRYLRSVNFDANQAALLFNYNNVRLDRVGGQTCRWLLNGPSQSWREQFGVTKLTVAHVAKQLRQGKVRYLCKCIVSSADCIFGSGAASSWGSGQARAASDRCARPQSRSQLRLH